jgi:hypothetical protein
MKSHLFARSFSGLMAAMLFTAWQLQAGGEPVSVHHPQGTLHGFLELRSEEGLVLAAGDLVQVTNGNVVTSHVVFQFKDGSVDDETTVFSQRRTFQLIRYHHLQKGPYFPHPIDLSIDSHGNNVTVRSTDDDGKENTKSDHIDLPQDLANGLVPYIMANIPQDTAETKVSMLVATPKPRLVKLSISSRGEEKFSVAGASRKAQHFEIKIELGGLTGVVAPMIGKAPPNIEVWTTSGEAPMFIREKGPLYPEGPILTIQLASPVWEDSSNPASK